MAADRIVINRTKQAGNSFVRAADLVGELMNVLDKLNLIAGHGNDGATYTVMEADFGMQAGAGANSATLLGLINNIFNTNTDVTGINRLAQLREFVGRVGGQ